MFKMLTLLMNKVLCFLSNSYLTLWNAHEEKFLLFRYHIIAAVNTHSYTISSIICFSLLNYMFFFICLSLD